MKRALVISGGGSKGAFAVGVLQQLRTIFPTLHFDIFVGTSTGALITPFAALEDIDLLRQIYTTVHTGDIIEQHRIGDRLNEKSIYTVGPLNELLKKHITDARFNAIQASGRKIYIVTTCLQTEQTMVYTNEAAPKTSDLYQTKKVQNTEHLRFAVLASACQPVLMTPIKVDANVGSGEDKNFQYVDGGVREYAGIQMAIDQGATEVFAILLSDSKGEAVDTEFTSLFPILERTLSIMIEDVKKNDVYIPEQLEKALQYIDNVKQKMKADGVAQSKIDEYFHISGNSNPLESGSPVKVFIMRPPVALGGGPGGLVFDPAEMSQMVAIGNTVGDDFAANLPPEDQTWLV